MCNEVINNSGGRLESNVWIRRGINEMWRATQTQNPPNQKNDAHHAGHQILNELIQIIWIFDIHSVHIPCCSGHAFDKMLLDSVVGRSTTAVACNVNSILSQRQRLFVFSKWRWQLKAFLTPRPLLCPLFEMAAVIKSFLLSLSICTICCRDYTVC